MRKPHEKNLEPHIEEDHIPHAQFAGEKIILRHQDPALEIKLQESQEQAAVFQKVCLQPGKIGRPRVSALRTGINL